MWSNGRTSPAFCWDTCEQFQVELQEASLDGRQIETQVIVPWPEPVGMPSFLAVSLPPDSCRIYPDKTGAFLSVPMGSRKFRLKTGWKWPEFSEKIRQESGGKEPVEYRSETVGTGENRPDPTQKSPGSRRLFEVPATGLIDLGPCQEKSVNADLWLIFSVHLSFRHLDCLSHLNDIPIEAFLLFHPLTCAYCLIAHQSWSNR